MYMYIHARIPNKNDLTCRKRKQSRAHISCWFTTTNGVIIIIISKKLRDFTQARTDKVQTVLFPRPDAAAAAQVNLCDYVIRGSTSVRLVKKENGYGYIYTVKRSRPSGFRSQVFIAIITSSQKLHCRSLHISRGTAYTSVGGFRIVFRWTERVRVANKPFRGRFVKNENTIYYREPPWHTRIPAAYVYI